MTVEHPMEWDDYDAATAKPEPKAKTVEWYEGMEAYNAGKSHTECPYTYYPGLTLTRYDYWQHGYNCAEEVDATKLG